MAGSGVTESKLPELTDGWLSGRRVAFVGRLGSLNRRRARQIVREAGGSAAESADDPAADLIVIGADQDFAGDYAALLNEEVVSRSDAGRLEIISETEWWRRMGVVDEDRDATRRLYTPAMLADLLKLPLSTIRRWQRRGLIQPVSQIHRLPYYDFEEVAAARQLARLVAGGHSAQLIETRLARLAGKFPGLQRPLSQLSLIVEGGEILLREAGRLVESGGQLRFDFESLEPGADGPDRPDPPPVVHERQTLGFPRSAPGEALPRPRTAEDFLALASDLEEDGETRAAAEVYRSMMLTLGATSEAAFRLAELLYSTGSLEAARERYSMAVELTPDFVEARASLGCVLVEMNQPEQALTAFEETLKLHPDYPDVHYHLARLLDDAGRADEASGHWHFFLRLAPQSPWAGEARQRLDLQVHDPGPAGS